MTRLFLIFIFALGMGAVHGQTKYKYEYPIRLKDQPSTYTTQAGDTALKDKSAISFTIVDNKGDTLPLAVIKIKSNKIDTSMRSDSKGNANITLPSDTFSISVFSLGYSALAVNKIYVKPNSKINFRTSLGKSNASRIGHIYSQRKLTENEVGKIVDDLSNDKDSELIKNKTCNVGWEI